VSALLESLKSGFDALPPALLDAQGLGATRRTAMAQALADGLPQGERWKYTALRALAARRFAADAAPAARVDPSLLADLPSPRLVFVNGRHDASLSDLHGLEAGVSVRPLSQALGGDDPRQVNVLARRFDAADEAFARLNAALAFEGALVRVEADAKIAAPLHLVFVGADGGRELAVHARHLIELRERAELTVVEHHLAADGHRHLHNHLLHAHLKPGSRLTQVRVQDESENAALIARTDAVLASDAEYRRVDLEFGAALSRHELNVSLQGERAKIISGGALLGGGRRHLDTRLGIEHVARDSVCDLRWRGLAGDRSRVVFHGGILIRAGADGSDAALSNKNLLLSDRAEIDTQPVLEIHADEVKAAHGATVGRLDPTALFYLRSRGIDEATARALLTLAFCREALLPLADESLIEQLSMRLQRRLAAQGSIA
jgi:Fe-S cluster assembly protein SufD